MRILNLQGMHEPYHNYNYEMIKHGIPEANITTINTDLCNMKPSALIHDCNLEEYDIVVANCFGGIYGYIVGGIQKIPTILINPMIPPMKYIYQLFPSYKYINQLPEIWNTYDNINHNVHLLLGDNDVTVDPVLTQHSVYAISVNHFEEGHTPVGDMFEYILINKIQGLGGNYES